jgi:hypothetical protein
MLLRARDPDLRFELSSEPPRSLAGYDLDSALSGSETSPATRLLNEAAGIYLRHFRTKPIRRIRGPEYDWFNIDFTEPPDARIRCCSPCCP